MGYLFICSIIARVFYFVITSISLHVSFECISDKRVVVVVLLVVIYRACVCLY